MSDDNSVTPITGNGGSPFDRIRHVDEHGEEYWSARELMSPMAYTRWNEFRPVIERAMRSAENQNYEVSHLFRVKPEKSGGRPREDYHLTRTASYLVAMNGDPRKEEVAAAQGYFAARTREAELATGKPMSEIEMARRYVAVLEREERLHRELQVARPKASKWDDYCNTDGLIGMTELADILKTDVRKLTAWLVEIGMFRKQTSRSGGNRNMPRKALQDSGHFEVKTESRNGVAFPVAYATPRGIDLVVDSWATKGKAVSPPKTA